MNNDEFSKILGFSTGLERDISLKIRKITALRCKLATDSIMPSDDTESLNRKTFDGWNNEQCLMNLERAFGVSLAGVKLPNFSQERFFFFYKKATPVNFGAWVKMTVEILTPILAGRTGNQRGDKNQSDLENDLI